jgi:SAM-dependent methyltransferase
MIEPPARRTSVRATEPRRPPESLYAKYVLPALIDLAMRGPAARRERIQFVPFASGVVLEVGVGSGLNLPFYPSTVEKLYALDPSPELLRKAWQRASRAGFPVAFIEGSAEAIPLDEGVADTVVMTWTLCTIPDPARAHAEMRRVLKRAGRLLFIEHGRAPEPGVRAWQARLTPLWRRIGGGCHLDRPIDGLLAEGGFELERVVFGYGKGPKPFAYLYRGLARRSDHPSIARGTANDAEGTQHGQ